MKVRTHLAESRMSHTLMKDVETVKTRPELLQYLTDTTLLGCPLSVTISCPVTRFHILHVRSVGKKKIGEKLYHNLQP